MIFISYSSEDVEAATGLYEHLINTGYSCRDIFLDRDQRSGIKLGTDWEAELLRNVSQCRVLLVLCSPNWLESRWCFAELAVAKRMKSGIHIIPLVLSNLGDEGWRKSGVLGLQKFQFDQNATSEQRVAMLDLLLQQLKRLGLGPADHLQPAIDHHPDRVLYKCSTWAKWSTQPDMSVSLQMGTEQQAFITSLSQQLTVKGSEIRISGDPGSGKTRLVLEAIRLDEDLQRQVLYYEDPIGFLEEPYINELSRAGNEATHVFVVDDCHSRYYGSTRSQITAIRDRVVMVTITHDTEFHSTQVPPLPDDQIAAILASYRGDLGQLMREYVACCQHSPRFAHLVGESLKADAGSIVAHPDAGRIVERIICGKAGTASVEAQMRMTIARFASLFDRFGVEQPYTKEIEALASWIAEYHPSIGIGDVLNAVQDLRCIRVLQGKRTVYFVPKALQWHLWRQWWQIYGGVFKMQQLDSLDRDLQSWFVRSLEQYSETSPIDDLADKLLRFDDWFLNLENVHNRWGAHLFHVLGINSPEIALTCIGRIQMHAFDETQRSFSDWVKSKSASLNAMIEVMDDACVWRPTALRSMRMLREFALAEQDHNGQATKAYCHFFTLGTGNVASTELEPKERAVVLDDLLLSVKPDERRLGLLSLSAALDRKQHGRFRGWARRERRQAPAFWVPANHQAYLAEHIAMWDRLTMFLQKPCSSDELTQGWNIIGSAFHAFVQNTGLSSHCLQSLHSVSMICNVSLTRELIRSIVHLWRVGSNLPGETRQEIKTLYFAIVGRTFETRLKRYVGMAFFEDDRTLKFDVPPLDDAAEEVQKLAGECHAHRELLRPLVPWLLTSAQRTWQFGFEIGTRDVNREWATDTITWQRQKPPGSNTAFIGGYLEAIRRRSSLEFTELVQVIAEEAELKELLPEIVARTGGITETVELITLLLSKEEIPVETLSSLRYVCKLSGIPEPAFFRWIEFLRSNGGHDPLGLALDFLHSRYKHESCTPFPTQFVGEFLAEPLVIEMVTISRMERHNWDYNWGQLLELVLANDPTRAVLVVRSFFESFLQEPTSFSIRHGNSVDESVWRVLEIEPQAAWTAFFDVLGRTEGRSTYEMFHWLGAKAYYSDGTNFGLWPAVPELLLWEWIDEELPDRAELAAGQLPPLVTEYGLTEITCNFLRRYSGCTKAYDLLTRSHFSGLVEGSREEFNKKRLQQAIEARASASDAQVLNWLNHHIEDLTAAVERDARDDDAEERGSRFR